MSTVTVPTVHRFLGFFESAPSPSEYHRDPDYAADDPGTVTITLIQSGAGTTVYTFGTDDEVAKQASGYYTAEIYLGTAATYSYEWGGDTEGGSVIAHVAGTVVGVDP